MKDASPHLAGLDREVIQVLARLGAAPYDDLDRLPQSEALAIARPAMPSAPPPAGAEDRAIAARDGAALRMRLYGAKGAVGRPVMLHLHGGGFVAGTIELDDARCARLAEETGCIVASLDYRLAPEFPFPTAIEDAYAAWAYLRDEAASFGGDPRFLAVSGSSAGGHIAIGLSLLTRARGGSTPLFQVLTYPVIDPRLDSRSYRDFAAGPFLTRARMDWYWRQYQNAEAGAGDLWNPMLSDPAGMPPTQVITAQFDVLRDEGEAFAARLDAAGVPVRVSRHDGMIHGFITMLPAHAQTDAALRETARFMEDGFGGLLASPGT